MKYTLETPKPSEIPVVVSLRDDGQYGNVTLMLTKGDLEIELLRLTTTGKIAMVVGNGDDLEKMGFNTVVRPGGNSNGRTLEVY